MVTLHPEGVFSFRNSVPILLTQNQEKFHEKHLVQDTPENVFAIITNFHLGQKFCHHLFSNFLSEMKIGYNSEHYSEPVKISGWDFQ